MNKGLIIGLVAAGVAITVAAVAKITEKKYVETNTTDTESAPAETLKEKTENMMKKAVTFAVTHTEEISAVGQVIGVLATAVGLFVSVHDLRNAEKRDRNIQDIHDWMEVFASTDKFMITKGVGTDDTFNKLFDGMFEVA